MVAEWKEFLWDVPEERIALWSHCQTLFLRYSFPALQVCFFYCQVTSDMIYCSFVSPNFQVISILLPVDRTFIFLFLFFFFFGGGGEGGLSGSCQSTCSVVEAI